MKSEELLDQLKVRFNTEPKKYEKADYEVLLKLLEELLTNNCYNQNLAEEAKSIVKNLQLISVLWQNE